MNNSRYNHTRPVICLDTGTVYSSLTAAAQSIAKTPATIRAAIRRKGTAAGMRWAYADDHRSYILCVETEKKYRTLREASLDNYLSEAAISKAITSDRPTGNRTFKRIGGCQQPMGDRRGMQ